MGWVSAALDHGHQPAAGALAVDAHRAEWAVSGPDEHDVVPGPHRGGGGVPAVLLDGGAHLDGRDVAPAAAEEEAEVGEGALDLKKQTNTSVS